MSLVCPRSNVKLTLSRTTKSVPARGKQWSGPCPAGWTAEPVPDLVWPADHWSDAQAVFLQRFETLTTATQTAALR